MKKILFCLLASFFFPLLLDPAFDVIKIILLVWKVWVGGILYSEREKKESD